MKRRNSIYYQDLHNPTLVPIQKYKSKSGYRIIVYNKFDPKNGNTKYLAVYKHSYLLGSIESGWKGDYLDVTDYVNSFDDLLDDITDKITRRYFLGLVRSFPLHPGTVYGDFLGKDNRVDWEKVSKYEDSFPENDSRIYFKNLSRRDTKKLQRQGVL